MDNSISLLEMQISSHITGEEDAILVMSLNPPAAILFIISASLSESFTRFTRAYARTWGRWLMAAVDLSCKPYSMVRGIAPKEEMKLAVLYVSL